MVRRVLPLNIYYSNIVNYLFQGELFNNIEPLVYPNSQVTTLSWHPSRKTLVITWDNGDIRLWNGDTEYTFVQKSGTSPVQMGSWSQQGGRYLTIDNVSVRHNSILIKTHLRPFKLVMASQVKVLSFILFITIILPILI